MDFRRHLSPSLQWKWHIQDFKIRTVEELTDASVSVSFRPRYGMMFPLARLVYGRDLPLTSLSSVRLGSIAAIICAGLTLHKTRKDGEVIARDFHVDCRKPIVYDENSTLVVQATVKLLRETPRYHLLASEFTIGDEGAHSGRTKLLYAKSGVQGLAYL